MKLKFFVPFLISLVLVISIFVTAGTISNNSTPESTGYTLTDIHNLINNISTTTPGNHDFSPNIPTSTTSFLTISQIYLELANLIQAEDLASTSVTYLGVTGGEATPEPITDISPTFDSNTTPGTATGYTLTDIYNLIHNNTRNYSYPRIRTLSANKILFSIIPQLVVFFDSIFFNSASKASFGVW
jgi:hypothetical protein